MSETAVNLSTVYGALPVSERARAAREAGFDRVESWWEFGHPNEAEPALAEFLDTIEANDLTLVALNSFAGDRDRGEVGIASLKGRGDDFARSIDALIPIARRTGVNRFNVTFGVLDETDARQVERGAERLAWAAERVAEIDGVILIEPLSTPSPYLFRSDEDVTSFLDRYLPGVDGVGLLFDTFHLAANGVDILEAWARSGAAVRHLQLADYPGRDAPGTGELPLDQLLELVHESDYSGETALEYLPAEDAPSV